MVQRNSSPHCGKRAFSRSTEKSLRVYARGRMVGRRPVDRSKVVGGKRNRRACLRLLRASVASRRCIHESRPRVVATARTASRFRPRGCVTCRASRIRREVEQCSRASRSRRSPSSRRAPARALPRGTMSRGHAPF